MTEYTAEDFERAEFAFKGERSVARRVKPCPTDDPDHIISSYDPKTPWRANEFWLSDDRMAVNGWTPVRTEKSVHADQQARELAESEKGRIAAMKALERADKALEVTDEMERRMINKGVEFGWFSKSDLNERDTRGKVHSLLIAALAEPYYPSWADAPAVYAVCNEDPKSERRLWWRDETDSWRSVDGELSTATKTLTSVTPLYPDEDEFVPDYDKLCGRGPCALEDGHDGDCRC